MTSRYNERFGSSDAIIVAQKLRIEDCGGLIVVFPRNKSFNIFVKLRQPGVPCSAYTASTEVSHVVVTKEITRYLEEECIQMKT